MNIQLFDFSVDLLQALLWQYNVAENLEYLLTKKQEWYNTNQRDFWQNWYTDVFNLDTANEFGLSVWSILLDTPLQIGQPPDPIDKPIFGFGAEGVGTNTNQNFNNGNFSSTGTVFQLTEAEKRIVLKLRYYQLTSSCAIPEINRSLALVFKDYPGQAYVLDGLNMTIKTVFTFDPGDRLLYILKQYDLIPRGAGVGIKYIIASDTIFGFGSETAEPNNNQNFTNGDFLNNEV